MSKQLASDTFCLDRENRQMRQKTCKRQKRDSNVIKNVVDVAIFVYSVKHLANHLKNLFCITFRIYTAENKYFESCGVCR